LREFLTLGGAEISQLTIAAHQSADPVAHLTAVLTENAEAKRATIEEHFAKRRKEDERLIGNVIAWPQSDLLHLKEQPWVKANGRRYGYILRSDVVNDRWVVFVKDSEESEEFASLKEMVETWSVD